MIYFLTILIIYLLFDVHYRFRNVASALDYFSLSKNMIDKTLIEKGLITKEELEITEKEILGNMPYDEYLRMKKSLKKINVHINYE